MRVNPIQTLRRLREYRRSPRRHGISLVEVLVAMFVLMVGLMGVAAMLPLGKLKMTKGDIDDRQAAVSDAAFESIKNFGVSNPKQWRTDSGALYDAVTPAGFRILCPVTGAPTASQFSTSASLSNVDEFYKSCVVRFVRGPLRGMERCVHSYAGASSTFTFDSLGGPSYAPFPAAPAVGDTFVVIRNVPIAVDPVMIAHQGNAAGDFAPGMKRITVASPASGSAMGIGEAESLCVSNDDLEFKERASETAPPVQLYYGADEKRKFLGNFSWAATFVPMTTGAARTQTPAANTSFYTLSVIIYHKRIVRNANVALPDNVAVELNFSGGGYGGGDAQIKSDTPGRVDEAEPGRWLHAVSADQSAYHWYRILGASEVYQGTDTKWTREITLAGPDWSYGAGATGVMYQGLVGVYQRTMKVENLPTSSN